MSTPKIAVVTGGSRGIGRAICHSLARAGARVVVNYNTNQEAADETVRAIQDAGGDALALRGDWSDDAARDSFFHELASTCGGLDWLINNAGSAEFAPLSDVTPQSFDAMFGLNVRGLLFGTQAAAAMMRDGGRIVNISSGITRINASGAGVYAASKAAVEMFTKAWAAELGPRGITVNTVSPGMTKTDLLLQVTSEEALESHKAQTPLGRLGEPDDIADVVAFLCSPEARWVTAQNILANGGVG
jgi:3-oxoacyl-[acyl-carrier protein] reductase